jgi:glycosyltransferase involved in cell wall biosynthesis
MRARHSEPAPAGPKNLVLMLVENYSVPLDQRVWPECLALKRAGYDVAVICPAGTERDIEHHVVHEGIEIHRYRQSFSSGGIGGYAREYLTALWQTWRLVLRVARDRRIAVVHAANPPDFLLPAVLPLKLRGTRFVFDVHDLVPELYLSRFGRGRDALYRATRLLERLSFRTSDLVIATNESYRRISIERGGKRPEDVVVVRNGPNLERFRAAEPDETLKRGRTYLLAYVGVMGPQDGIDVALDALTHLRDRRQDWLAVFVGDGDVLPAMRRRTEELGLSEYVEFTGYVDDDSRLRTILSTADLCLAPEPRSPLNDLSTMMKIAEYMAMARPVVAFDLPETVVTAGAAAAVVPGNDVDAFAQAIGELLDDADRRAEMGRAGRERVEAKLAWGHSERHLVDAYADLLMTR